LVFDRFLARVVAVLGDAVLLKGGLVLELRLERARTTKDIDLRVTGCVHSGNPVCSHVIRVRKLSLTGDTPR
jgi:hypothetical protein